MLKDLFYFIVFPGFLFSSIAGGFLSWFDRKLTAWLQFRKGPPVLQAFYDVGKLMSKETILPRYGEKITFLTAPVISLFAASISGVFIFIPAFFLASGFTGDIFVVFYFLALPSVAYMIGAASSANPMAMMGVSREMKLILGYELALLLVMATIIYKSGMSIRISDILSWQQTHGPFIGSISGVVLFIVALFCMQAKLGLVPFDISEAESELTHGLFIEYSGLAYSLIKLTKYVMLFVLSAFMGVLFFGGFLLSGIGILWSVLKLLLIAILFTLIRNTNPRVRIDQAMRFFFVWMNALVILAFIISIFGI